MNSVKTVKKSTYRRIIKNYIDSFTSIVNFRLHHWANYIWVKKKFQYTHCDTMILCSSVSSRYHVTELPLQILGDKNTFSAVQFFVT